MMVSCSFYSSQLGEQLDEVKSTMDERGNSMTDTTPLVKIKKALQRLKREIKEMELRMGVVSHTIMQAKIRSRHHRDKRIEHSMQGHRRGDVDAPDEDDHQEFEADFHD